MMIHIMVIEDDHNINKLFCTVLKRNGYETFAAYDGNHAINLLDTTHIDLIITDIMMPNMDGYEFVSLIRKSNTETPILMITAKELLESKTKAFNLGVDDYMTKPIDTEEMLLRVKALLRRAKIATDHQIQIDNTLINYDTFSVTFDNTEIFLPQKEFKLLYKLASYPNKIFTRQQLMDDIWGLDSETDERSVDVHINRLRDRLKNCKDFEIISVRGLGYKVVNS